jgi:tetratricopeptide (TPR) repeat protein
VIAGDRRGDRTEESLPKVEDRRMTGGRRFWWAILGLWILSVSAHVAGALWFPDQLWGSHLYRFATPAVVVLGVTLALLAGGLLFAGPAELPSLRLSRRHRPILEMAAAAAGLVVFWTFRVRHLLLGDSYIVVNTLPMGGGLHPREPLTIFLHQSVYRALRHLPAMSALPATEAAWRSVALESAACGAGFIFVVLHIAREIVRLGNGGASSVAVALVLAAQGYALLFFGYVENYTYLILAMAVYLLVALRYLRGRGHLLTPAVVLLVASWLHLSAVALVPSFMVLVIHGTRQRETRPKAIRDLLLAATFVLMSFAIPSLLGSQWNGLRMVQNIMGEAWRGHRTGSGLSYMFSGRHFRDFFSEQFLIGPLGMFLLLPAAVVAIARRTWKRSAPLYLLAAALVPLAGAWAASDPGLGYPRDWDIFAPWGLMFTAAGLGLFQVRQAGRETLGRAKEPAAVRALLCAGALSLFHLVPWVAVNTSQDRALERAKLVPMGYGRGQVVVGRYYLERKMYPDAKLWFEKSLREYPRNVNAYQLLGSMYLEQGSWADAASAYEGAIRCRPDRLDFHSQYAQALVRLGRYREAEKHLRYVAERLPDDPNAWEALGLVLQQLGDADSARAALDRADANQRKTRSARGGLSPPQP